MHRKKSFIKMHRTKTLKEIISLIYAKKEIISLIYAQKEKFP